MKISELTENDVIHIRNKKEAKGIAELLNMKGVKYWKSKQGLNLDRATKHPIQVYEDEFGTAFNYFEKDTSGKNIIPASKFLKQSISKKDLQEALSKVGEELSSMNERLGKLEAKNEPSQTANGIEVHFDEVTEGLPEKWCIKLTKENYKVLKTGYELDSYIEPFGYHHSDKVNTYNHWEEYKVSGYTEITFETFKKYVLKEEVKEDVELEVNKWYKDPKSSFLVYVLAILKDDDAVSGYGVSFENEWFNEIAVDAEGLIPATESEVFEALKAEAERRGFKEGVIVKNHQGENELVDFDIRFMKEYNNGIYVFNSYRTGVWLMMNGIWATIIPQPEAIDFSKAGQLVQNNKGDLLLTTGEQSHSTFEAIVIKHHLSKKPKIRAAKSCFTLCTEPVTLSN